MSVVVVGGTGVKTPPLSSVTPICTTPDDGEPPSFCNQKLTVYADPTVVENDW
jgi:hypothetical protein